MVSNYRNMTPRRRPLFVMVRCTSAFLSLRCADVVYLQTRR
uniref:Uncharacterized protein n=1 Tax=Salmonella phage vB_SE130_2P TaxID=3236707 RepID=A0AB39C5G0_9VIRU